MGDRMKKYVIGRVKVTPGIRDEYLKACGDYVETSRKDAGCIYYKQGPDSDDPNGVIVVECWESPELHAAHTRQPYFAAFGPTFMSYVVSATFEEMDVGEVNEVLIGGN
jgi:quinol monooxygenase YgiN